MEFLFGPAPTLFYLEHRVAWQPPGDRRHPDSLYRAVVATRLHLHLRYSAFFIETGEGPSEVKLAANKKRALTSQVHNPSEIDVRRYLRMSDMTRPMLSAPEEVETLSEEEVTRAPETGWQVRLHPIRF